MNRPAGVTTTAILIGVIDAIGWAAIEWHASHAVTRFAIYTSLIAFTYAVLWFYWQRDNRARLYVLASSVLAVLNLAIWNEVRTGLVAWLVHVMLVVEAALGLFLLYWLNTSKIPHWFKEGHFAG